MSAQELLSRGRAIAVGLAFGAAVFAAAPTFAADASCGQDYYDGLRAFDAGNRDAARGIWERSALSGDVRSQYRLGEIYETGDRVIINFVVAHKWYNLAANNDLQQCSGDFGSKEARQARDHAREARDRIEDVMTNRALADAQKQIVDVYECKSDTRSLYQLGRIYQSGAGLPQSSIDACRYYAVSAAKNGPSSSAARDALDVLNQVLSPDQIDNCQREAAKFKRPSSDICEVSFGGSTCVGANKVPVPNRQAALKALGYYHSSIDGSLGSATRAAIREFQREMNAQANGDLTDTQICTLIDRAASSGDGISQATLGEMYYSGIGKTKNYDAARDWLDQAADKAVPSALFRLGMMYASGNGVNKDVYRGCDYLRQADSLGHPGADREMNKYCSN